MSTDREFYTGNVVNSTTTTTTTTTPTNTTTTTTIATSNNNNNNNNREHFFKKLVSNSIFSWIQQKILKFRTAKVSLSSKKRVHTFNKNFFNY